MKILQVSTARSWRGGEQQLAYLHEELAAQGVEQLLLCPKGSELAQYCHRKAIPYRAVAKRSSLDFSFAKAIARLARSEKTDLVHLHDSHAHTFGVLASLLYGLKTPMVLHRRVAFPVKDSAFSRFKYNFRQISKIICVSQEVKRVLDQSLKDPSRSLVIHSGIDTARFQKSSPNILRQEFGLADHLSLLGNIAALSFEKGYRSFVKAARLILDQHEDVHFFIIGEGEERSQIEALVQAEGLESHVSFTGFRSDIEKLLPALDILLFPSEREGLGTTVLDAFAAKVAVVASATGGITELITTGQNGLLAPVADARQMAEHCLHLIENPALRQSLTTEAFKEVQKYDKQLMAGKVLQLYQELLKA